MTIDDKHARCIALICDLTHNLVNDAAGHLADVHLIRCNPDITQSRI